MSDRLEVVLRTHVKRILEECGGNVTQAAKRLDVYRSTLQRWRARWAVDPDAVVFGYAARRHRIDDRHRR